jgi:hypothetical protein
MKTFLGTYIIAMKETYLVKIEQALQIQLPSDYREIMLQVAYDYSSDYWLAMCEMPDDADLVIKWNVDFRGQGLVTSEQWRPYFFTFGHNGFGDHYFFDLQSGSQEVFCIFHEGGEIKKVASNLHKFIDDRLRVDVEAERLLEERTRKDPGWAKKQRKISRIGFDEVIVNEKKWWQFWKRRYTRRRY